MIARAMFHGCLTEFSQAFQSGGKLLTNKYHECLVARPDQSSCKLMAARYSRGTIIAAASHEISTSQFRNMLRIKVVISVQKSTDVSPLFGARKLLKSLRWRTGCGSGFRVESGRRFNSVTTPRMPSGSFLIHALNQLPMYPPPDTVER